MTLLDKLRRQRPSSAFLAIGTLALGILIGTVLTSEWGTISAQSGAADATPLTVPPVAVIGNEFSQLAKKLEESVVAIRVELPPAARGQGGDIPDLFRRFLPEELPPDAPVPPGDLEPGPLDDAPQGPPRQASGTGFILDKNGYIMTNNHVVENATRITVSLTNDSTEYRARLMGTDCESDLAIIKIEAHRPLKPVSIANSDSVQVGDWAVAIGSPFGLASSVTAGIVSAIGRGPDQLPGESKQFQNFIQTDAAINPGNSGGPLLNIRGEVIAVNTAIRTSSGGSEGIGFALPMNMGARVYNDIIRYGRVTRGSIGVTLSQANRPELVLRAFKLDHGALIDGVQDGLPAAQGGLKVGDIVLSINGKRVKDNQDLIAIVADLPVGRPAVFSIDRDRKLMDLNVTAQNREELFKDNPTIACNGKPPAVLESKAVAPEDMRFGFVVRGSITAQEKNMVPSGNGIVIASVEEDSFAADLGLIDNDIVESINRQPVNSVEDINKLRVTLKPGDPVAFHVYRPQQAAPGRGKNRASARTSSGEAFSIFLAGTVPEN